MLLRMKLLSKIMLWRSMMLMRLQTFEQELKAKESLRDAQGISEFHQKETERLRSMSSFTGQT